MSKKIIPKQFNPKDDREYFEILSKAVFNAGFSYQVVENKWEDMKKILDNFDPAVISKWSKARIADILLSPDVIRNPRKIEALKFNALKLLEMSSHFKGFKNYLKTINHLPYDEFVKEFSKNFKWVGRM